MLLASAALPMTAGAAAPTKTTTTPKGAPATTTPTIHWNTAVRVEKSLYGGLNGVSCPGPKLCVAVDNAGQVAWSGAPLSRFWHLAAVDKTNSLTAISCPLTTFCVAVDDAGYMVWSNAPTGGLRKWAHPKKIDAAEAPGGGWAGLTSIDCPTTRLCVATDGANPGNVIVSTNPTGGSAAWVPIKIGGTNSLGGSLASVSCIATTFCVVTGSQHYYSIAPAAGATAWHASGGPTAGGLLASINCPAVTECVGVGYGNSSIGLSDVSAHPIGGLIGWVTTAITGTPPVLGAGLVDTVGCPSIGFCVAVDSVDHAYTTTAPLTGNWIGGTAIRPKSVAQSSAITCEKAFCMVVDSAGMETVGVVRAA